MGYGGEERKEEKESADGWGRAVGGRRAGPGHQSLRGRERVAWPLGCSRAERGKLGREGKRESWASAGFPGGFPFSFYFISKPFSKPFF